jgi:hypothetical protein
MAEWKKIQQFFDYSVSDEGEIRRDSYDRLMTQYANQYGVICVGMTEDGYQRRRSVSKLVAKAFVDGETETFDTPICMDGDRWNCWANNLVWRPRWFAVKYNQQFRNPYEHRIERDLYNRDTDEKFVNSFEAAKWFGLLESDLVLSIANRTYVWPTYHFFEVIL